MPQKKTSTRKTSNKMKLQTSPVFVEVKSSKKATKAKIAEMKMQKSLKTTKDILNIKVTKAVVEKTTKTKKPSTNELVDAVQATINARNTIKDPAKKGVKETPITSYSMPQKNKLETYPSIKEASDSLKISQASIRDIANGKHPFNHKHNLVFAFTNKPLPKYWKKLNLLTKIGDINPAQKALLDKKVAKAAKKS